MFSGKKRLERNIKKTYDVIYAEKSKNYMYRNKVNVCIIENVVGDLNIILNNSANLLTILLEEKGFSNSIYNRTEKSVLLMTEVAELTDAVKKGLGAECEAEELADIVLRASNFVSANEVFLDYKNLCKHIGHSDKHIITEILANYVEDEVQAKFDMLERMFVVAGRINQSTKYLERTYCERRDKLKPTALINMWMDLLELIAYCDSYCEVFLKEDLRKQIQLKWEKNMKRGYRYNTCY